MSEGRTLYTADLYCGGGGFTSGLAAAAKKRGVEVKHVGVNHMNVWELPKLVAEPVSGNTGGRHERNDH